LLKRSLKGCAESRNEAGAIRTESSLSTFIKKYDILSSVSMEKFNSIEAEFPKMQFWVFQSLLIGRKDFLVKN